MKPEWWHVAVNELRWLFSALIGNYELVVLSLIFYIVTSFVFLLVSSTYTLLSWDRCRLKVKNTQSHHKVRPLSPSDVSADVSMTRTIL